MKIQTECTHLETNFTEFFRVDEEATIEKEGGLAHRVVDLHPIDLRKFFPFRGDDDGLRAAACLHGRGGNRDMLLD